MGKSKELLALEGLEELLSIVRERRKLAQKAVDLQQADQEYQRLGTRLEAKLAALDTAINSPTPVSEALESVPGFQTAENLSDYLTGNATLYSFPRGYIDVLLSRMDLEMDTDDADEDDDTEEGLTLGELQQELRKGYLQLSHGAYAERVSISDLRKLFNVPRKVFDEAMLDLQDRGEVVLYRNDNTQEVTPENKAGAIIVGGHPRHLVYWEYPQHRR